MVKSRMLLGKISKTEGVDYLSDHQYLAQRNPGPSTYKAEPNRVKPRITAVKFNPSQGKKEWRPIKSKNPDVGSYETGKSKDFVSKSPFIHKFANVRESGGDGKPKSKETWTSIASK